MDRLGAATKAVAFGVDAVEIDVRAAGNELLATHDAPNDEQLVARGIDGIITERLDLMRLLGERP